MKLKGKEVLIVDDDSQYQFFLNNILVNLGISVVQAKNYSEAVEKLTSSIPHLVISDINLGEEKNGNDIQKYIKEKKELRDLPVIIITADANKQTIFQSLALGAHEYMLKPIEPKILIQKLRRIFLDYQTPEVQLINDLSGEYKTQYSKTFNDDFDIEIQTDINLRAINELSCILQGPVKFPKETMVNLDSALLNSIGGDGLGFRSIENSRTIEAGTFSTRFSLIGVDEKTAQKIRAMRVTKK